MKSCVCCESLRWKIPKASGMAADKLSSRYGGNFERIERTRARHDVGYVSG